MTIEGKVVRKYFKTEEDANSWKAEKVEQYSDKPLKGEEWKPIPGFSKYEASSFGRVRSLDYKRSGLVKVLAPALSRDKYYQTMLKNDKGVYKSWKIHKYIALAFHGENPLDEVNHMDGNKRNNRPSNLEYCTRSHNIQHAFDKGLMVPNRGELNNKAKLTEAQVKEIREAKRTKGRFWGRNELAAKFGVTAKHLQDIANDESLWEGV